ncbi:Uncharacterised protein [Lederbergia lenta]|uniref:Uncharacterized protein n=1 Tax=Lederbergia lenta TaxID=1467 RepID=A0A2X4WCE3_LEDLE|nr:Uncharacterised protein [Lederbergia lenta]
MFRGEQVRGLILIFAECDYDLYPLAPEASKYKDVAVLVYVPFNVEEARDVEGT